MHVEAGYAQTARSQAEFRKQLAAEAYAAGGKRSVCSDCGGAMYLAPGDYRHYCSDCGAERAIDGNTQMSMKAGPVYEKSAISQLRYWISECDRLHILPEGVKRPAGW